MTIYTEVSEKVREMMERGDQMEPCQAEQMLLALQHLSEYLYGKYKGYTDIEKEAIKMGESRWSFSKWRDEGRVEGSKETAKKMLLKNKPMDEIIEFTDLADKDLAEVLHELPQEIQSKYDFAAL